ncbi:MAG: hypothetical protein UH080_04310 [Ruminococcus sp.]|nr:hypothetical protein [Ruminococcus sp.]
MPVWSKMRHKLENEYLAPSLRGHIQYFCTRYTHSHDEEGRASIRLDGKEILKGCYYNFWLKFPEDEQTLEKRFRPFDYINETALKLGAFDQRSFYSAFEKFDNQSIEESLVSENLIVRIFAILDRRVGKRRLIKLKDNLNPEEEIFNTFFAIRAKAEGIINLDTENKKSGVIL